MSNIVDERILYNFISGHEPSGESAYDIWKALGNPGDADDFLEFLRTGTKGEDGTDGSDGADGKDGSDGKSAYQLALEGGYKGSEAEFIEKLAKTAVTIDSSLSKIGQAADAKVTGDAIANINKELENCLKEGDSVQIQIATEEQAKEAIDDTAVMTPYKTLLAIQEWGGSGGGGGGGGATIPYMTSTFENGAFPYGDSIAIRYEWGSPNLGKGNLYVIVNDVEYDKVEVTQGTNRYELSGLEKGSYTVQMYVIDRGGQYTDTLKYTIRVGALDITSSFNDSVDFNITSKIRIPITVDTISLEPIYMSRTIDNETVTLSAQNGYNIFEIPTLSAGAHKVKFQATSSVYTSNELVFDIIIADADNLTIISDFDKTEAVNRELLEIEYRVSLKGESKFNAEYYIDDKLSKSLTILSGKNIWSTRELTLGEHTLKVKVTTLDGSKSHELSWNLTVIPSTYTPLEPVIDDSLLAWFDATGKSNMDNDRETWIDKSGKETPITLYNINYGSNGWIDNALKLTGGAYAEIDLKALAENAPYGITVDIKFATRDIGSQDACVLDMRGSDTNGRGFAVDTQYMYLNSSTTKISSFVLEDTESRATFVLDRDEKIAKIYNNGVLSETFLMTSDEDFTNDTKIYLGTKLAFVDGIYQPSIYGDCEIYSIRVYERKLSGEEIVQNLIADIPDLEEQEAMYNLNYGDSTPTMYFYGDTSAMTKDVKVPLRIKYISTDSTKYGESFDLAACQVSWQGTSSLQYVIKNYKIRLRNEDGSKFKYTPFPNGIKESTFCLKADYMESSHANNTGMAKFINEELYDEAFPPQELDPNVRSTINGFPIHLYIAKDSTSTPEYIGIFNFNLDKGCTDSFGLDNEVEGFENCVSFEVASNSDTSAGAFRDDSDDSLRTDFELRYPDPEDISESQVDDYYTSLKRVVTWVKECTEETFKAEFEQYFNKEYTLKYFLQAHTFGMVDNLGKNLMFNSWDGLIWYPQFYDLDTELGLDNTGYIEFYSDVDVEEGSYNTSNSKLWTMVKTVFHDELCEMYKNMRTSGRYSVDNVMKYWYGEQVSKIGQLQYNKDMEAKYVKFKNDYLFMLHGRRYEHMFRWITERFLYLDTWYGYEENTKQSITIRANKEGEVSLDILTYSPQYLKVKWRNGVEQVLKVGRDALGKMIPTTFSGKLATATDQEVIIYNARHIKTINGLSGLNPSVLNVVEANKLTEIICDNSPLLADVRLNSENSFIGKMNFNGNGLLAGTLDLTAQRNLSYLNLNGTRLSNVLLATSGSNIKELHLDIATLKSVDVQNMPFLSDISINITNEFGTGPEYSTFKIINCPNAAIASKWNKIKICSENVHIESSPKVFSKATTIGIGTDINTRLSRLVIKDIVGKNIDTVKIKCANVEDLATTVNEFSIDCPCNKLQIFGLGFKTLQEYVNINTDNVNYFFMEKYTNIEKFNVASKLKGIHISHAQSSNDYMPWISIDGGTWTEKTGVKFSDSNDFTYMSIDGVECVDTMNFAQKTAMSLLHFGDGVLPSTIKTIILNCDFTNVVEINGRSRFKLPTDIVVKGNLVSVDGATIWCNATANSYPPMENLNELNWDLSRVTNFQYMFKYWKNLKSLTIKNCNIEYLMYAFLNCENLESINFENCNFDNTKTFASAFYGCRKLNSINGLSLHAVLPTKVATAKYNLPSTDVSVYDLFRYCNALPNDNIHEIINTIPDIESPSTDEKNSYSFSGTFYGCTLLTSIPEKVCKYGRDLSGTFRMTGINEEVNVDLPVALNVANMFYNSLVPKVTKFNAPNTEAANNIFDTCLYLESVDGLSIPKANNITSIFRSCKELKTINSVVCPKVAKYDLAFSGCSSLTSLGDINFTYVWRNGLRNSSGELETNPGIYSETGKITHAIYNGIAGSYIAYDGLCEKNPLDAASVESLINCLDTADSPTVLKLHATAYANLTSSLISLASAKNWTLVSV